jgi:FkbM family methyltransferase
MTFDASISGTGANMENVVTGAVFELLKPERLTAVLDIGANPIDGDPPYKGMLERGLCTMVGFEPQAGVLANLQRRKGPQEKYLPIAVGDGTQRILYICRAQGMTSLLKPDPGHLALFNDFPSLGHIEQEVRVQTHRLDDIDAVEHVDFLKIDIQGSELEVLKSGQQKLSRAIAIQTEVSFVTLYQNQPTIGMVDIAMREMGFVPHCLAELKRWPIAPIVVDGNPRKSLRQLLEADIVYVRDFSSLKNMDREQWKHLALVAHYCYNSFDLALHSIIAASRLGAVASNTPQLYLDCLGQRRDNPLPR